MFLLDCKALHNMSNQTALLAGAAAGSNPAIEHIFLNELSVQ